jgi:intracellular sulfur oxidation DsrE/DsrF family protein
MGLGVVLTGSARAADAVAPLMGAGARALPDLMARLAKAPRRRDFKTVPMILDDSAQWDTEALKEIISYEGSAKQVWDNTVLESPWLNLMKNSLNAQIWSFKHPDFLVVSATHGTAHLALYDDAIWEKYQITKLAGEKFKTNTLMVAKSAPSNAADYEAPTGAFSAHDNSIPTLMRRGVVFLACHNAIWEQAGVLIEKEINPDKLSQEALAAEMTNHLIDGVVLTPGAVATLPELQSAGFHYAK